MQLHLDFTVSSPAELQTQRERAEALGAELLLDRTDDADEPLYVFADPSGHPFCIFVGVSRRRAHQGRTPTATQAGLKKLTKILLHSPSVSAPTSGPNCRCRWLAVHMIETTRGAPIEVADLDAEWLLELAREAATECWKAERRRLRLAAQWCVLHPATAETGFVTWSDTGLPGLCPRPRRRPGWGGDAAGGGVHAGTSGRRSRSPPWTGFAVVPSHPGPPPPLPRFGSNRSAPNAGAVKARKIAQATHNLSMAAAASVDAQLADGSARVGGGPSSLAVAQAIATHDPHLLETREKHGRDAWGVRLFHRGVGTDGGDDWVGTSHLEVTGDTLRASGIAAPLEAPWGSDAVEGALRRVEHRQAASDPPADQYHQTVGPSALIPDDRPDPAHLLPRTVWNDTVDPTQRGRWSKPRRPDLVPATRPPPQLSSPPWTGSPIPSQSVLLHCARPVRFQRVELRPLRGTRVWSSSVTGAACSRGARRDARACDVDHITRMTRTAHAGKPAPPPSRPSVDGTTARKRSVDGATTAPGRPLPMDRTPRPDLPGHPHRHHAPPAQLSGGRAPSGAAGPGRRGVLRRRSVKATRAGRLEATATAPPTVTRPDAGSPAQPPWYAAQPRTNRSGEPRVPARGAQRRRRRAPHNPEPTAADARRRTARTNQAEP